MAVIKDMDGKAALVIAGVCVHVSDRLVKIDDEIYRCMDKTTGELYTLREAIELLEEEARQCMKY